MFHSGFVAIIGEPNAGKSTLLNRWVGENLAIVTPKAQTTRQSIRGIVNRSDAQIIFVDTPGFHESTKALNMYMIDQVKHSIANADVCCLLVAPDAPLSEIDQHLLAYAKEKRKPVVIAVNKCDAVKAPISIEGALPISALTGDGCDALLDALVKELPESPPLYPDDIYTEHSERFLASEMIREVMLEEMHQELPYSAAVLIEEFKDKPEITVIKASIVVEKDSQKAMVIGSRGSMIKLLGQEARKRIEKMLDRKVFLELFVRVEKNWTKDPKKVGEMGYE
ncbi:MAG: GTPase Era [Deltaproteobacteria bacterium CG11_big_fil_rev_8_21_14_0_20_47_16]|nr:MAG: GTPase Era [Deltaproteobacteria bacterium CG11_big_fil_rev_8_21_14_0_20_47_16]